MNDLILSVENVSKQYQLGVFGTGSLGGDIKRWWYNLRGKEDPYLQLGETNVRSVAGNSKFVWALKDINFSVNRGEILGIIGKNGAGKSTLLKLLSRVTKPTNGEIRYNGRMASLLEVGTGFHPELTGKENIFLNGGILGMSRPEIQEKLDEIIDFSGCERYIDTPVKRYSSGMRVRLGFAVAAFLDPEILVVDEVLAVGDAEFQKKAIGKMQQVSSEQGRTVLFVSHNMASIQNLCSRGLIIDAGRITMIGSAEDAITQYLDISDNSESYVDLKDRERTTGRDVFRFEKIDFKDLDSNKTKTTILSGSKIKIVFSYISKNNIDDVQISLAFFSMTGQFICSCSSRLVDVHYRISIGKGVANCVIDKFPLSEGSYTYKIYAAARHDVLDVVENAGLITVIGGDYYKTGKLPPSNRPSALINFRYE